MARTTTLIAVALSTICLACSSDDSGDEHDNDESHHSNAESASAALEHKSDNTTLAGNAVFSGEKGKVSVKVTLTGAPEGEHGLHIHETGDCSAADAMSAGGHWNPTSQMHGHLGTTAHLGDIGNITVKADGTGEATATNPAWEIGTGTANDVKNKAVVVHGMPDDFTSQPAGNAGPRIGCGVIK